MNLSHKLLILMVFVFLLFSSCRKKKVENFDTTELSETQTIDTISKIKIYLENSKSMGGYFRGSTRFTDKIDSYIVGLDKGVNFKGKVEAHTISKELKTYKSIELFRDDFSPINGSKIATATTSPLDDILSRVYKSTKKGEVSIIITDGIPSGSNKEVQDNEDFNFHNKVKLKNDISISLDGIKEKNYTVLIKQGISDFIARKSNTKRQKNDHPYYFLDNTTFPDNYGKGITMVNRPYYLIIIGEKGLINQLEEKISFDSNNEICFNCSQQFQLEYCNSYKDLNNITFKDRKLNVRGRLGRGKDKYNNFAYLIKKNAAHERHQASNLTNEFESDVYILIDGGTDTLFVDDCLQIEDAKNKGICGLSQKNANQFTHLILFKDNSKMGRGQQYTLQIAKRVPRWIKDSHTDDDREISAGKSYEDFDKTFGLKFLIDGINMAFSIEENETLFTKSLN